MLVLKLLRAFMGLFACLSLLATVCFAEAMSKPAEYEVKAAFIYNFAKFVKWPDNTFKSSEEAIVLCILGDNPFGTALESFINKPLKERKLTVRSCRNLGDTEDCHMLYVSRSESNHLPKVLSRLKSLPIVTIGDMNDFSRRGGMINLIKINKKIRFEINPDTARRSNIKISSQLLKLARITKNKENE